ncbi:MAG: sigma-E factor negative regulatory protein [Succinivibrionaceae bacterium]
MTNERKNQIVSSFLDNENLSDDEIKKMVQDESCLLKLSNYAKIRAVLREEQFFEGMDSFSDKVMKQISNEETPNKSANDDVVVTGKEFIINKKKRFSYFHNISQIAIAATVACVSVFGVQYYIQESYLPELNNQDVAFSSNNLQVKPVTNVIKENYEGNVNNHMSYMMNNIRKETVDMPNEAETEKNAEIEKQKHDVLVSDAINVEPESDKRIISENR